MAFLECHALWTLTSTGGSTAPLNTMGYAERISAYFKTDSDCTCTIQLQSAARSSGPWTSLGSAANMSSAATALHQFSEPLMWVRPYITAMTASQTVTVELFGN